MCVFCVDGHMAMARDTGALRIAFSVWVDLVIVKASAIISDYVYPFWIRVRWILSKSRC